MEGSSSQPSNSGASISLQNLPSRGLFSAPVLSLNPGSGHAKDVLSIYWDTTGKYLAFVSEDRARIWSTASNGKCIYELQSNGNKFQSCTFHPGYSVLLIIGCYKSLEVWSASESNKTMTVPVHKGLVAALAATPKTDMVASGSYGRQTMEMSPFDVTLYMPG